MVVICDRFFDHIKHLEAVIIGLEGKFFVFDDQINTDVISNRAAFINQTFYCYQLGKGNLTGGFSRHDVVCGVIDYIAIALGE